jgi:hypothetical protein
LSETAQLVKTNSYGFFGYVVPGVVVTLYLIIVVSYIRYDDPLRILEVLHQFLPRGAESPAASAYRSGPYEYISFLLVFVVASYIIGHLSEACAQMIYDRFYMRRIYGHRLRQLILDEGTDRKETHKNFYRAAISSLYVVALVYLMAVWLHGQGFWNNYLGNVSIALIVISALGIAIGIFWFFESSARNEEERATEYLKDCEIALNLVDDSLRGEQLTEEDCQRILKLKNLWKNISQDQGWHCWLRDSGTEPLEVHLTGAVESLFNDGELKRDVLILAKDEPFATKSELFLARDSLRQACGRMRVLKGRNTRVVLWMSSLSLLAEIITNKFVDDERPISRQVKSKFHDGFRQQLGIECRPSLGSEVNRLPMWYIVENQRDLSAFIVKYRSQAAMMCNISGAFLLCTLLSAFAFNGRPFDRDFATIGIATLLISMFTSLRYFYVHDNDYVKTLIYSFVIGTKNNRIR